LAGRRTARRATLLFCFFPGSIVFSMVYSEGVMIALAAGCLLALQQRRWLLAGVLGGLATAARPNAVVLVVACGWAAVDAVVRRGWPAPVTAYTAGVLLMAAVYRVDVLRPRAILAAFPLFAAYGDRLSRRTVTVLVAAFAVALVLLPLYYTLPLASSSAP